MAGARKFRKRENGEGTFFRDANDYYCWKCKVGDNWLSAKGKTAEERDIRKAKKLKDLEARGGVSASNLDKSRTLGEYLDWWLEHLVKPPNRAYKTWHGYEQMVRLYIKPSLGTKKLGKLTSGMIREMVNGITHADRPGRPLSPRTAGYALTTVKKALNDACAENPPILTLNPAAPVKPPKLGPKKKRTLKPVAMNKVLDYDERDSRYAPMIALLITTGVRTSEALGWKWSDFDPTTQPRATIRVLRKLEWEPAPKDALGKRIGKAKWSFQDVKKPKSRRTIPFGEIALHALEQIRCQQAKERAAIGSHYEENDLIFTTELGTPVNHRNLQRALDQILAQAKLAHVGLHDLRKTNGSHLARQHVPMHVVQSLLGHESITTTELHYLDVLTDDMAEAASVFDSPYSAKVP